MKFNEFYKKYAKTQRQCKANKSKRRITTIRLDVIARVAEKHFHFETDEINKIKLCIYNEFKKYFLDCGQATASSGI